MNGRLLFVSVIAMFNMFLFGVWIGAGMGLFYCADTRDLGYTHGLFGSKYKVYCEIKKVKE